MTRAIYLILSLTLILSFGCQQSPNDQELAGDMEGSVHKFNLGGAPTEVEVWFSNDEISLIDYLNIVVRIVSKENTVVEPPHLPDEIFQPLALVEQPRIRSFWDETVNGWVNEWRYTFEPFESGEFTLRPFSVFFRLEKEKTADFSAWPIYEIQTDAIPYKVLPIDLDGSEDIKDIRGLILPPFNFIPLIITILVIMFVGISGLLIHRKIKGPPSETVSTAPDIDHQRVALEKISELESRDLIKQSAFDQFHTELALILREYIENRFHLKAREKTTEEFLTTIRSSALFDDWQRNNLQTFLNLSDLVKFASFQPVADVSQQSTETVRAFIQTTGVQHEV